MILPFSLRNNIDIQDVLYRLGVSIRQVKLGEITAQCPDPAHSDRKPSWSICTDIGSNKFGRHNCFSCGFKGDIITLWQVARDLPDRKEAYHELKDIYGKDDEDSIFTSFLNERAYSNFKNESKEIKFVEMPFEFELVEPGSAQWNWLMGRGLSEEIIVKHRIGYLTDDHKKMPGWVVFPIFFGGDTVGHFSRSMFQKKQLYSKGLPVSQIWYNWDNIDITKKEIIIVEGIIDCLRVLSTGYMQSYRKHSNIVATLGNRIQLPRSTLLKSFETIICAADGDDGGRILEREISKNYAGSTSILSVPIPEGEDPGSLSKDLLRRGIQSPRSLARHQASTRTVDYSIRGVRG